MRDFWIDVGIVTAFTAAFIIHIFFSCKSYKNVEMRNIHNNLMSVCIALCLIVHITTLLYSILFDKQKYFPKASIQGYLYVQLSFDLLNISVLAQFFQWLNVSYTLNYMIQVKERKTSKKASLQSRRSNIEENDEESGDDSMAFVNGKPQFKKDIASTQSFDEEDKATNSFLSWNTQDINEDFTFKSSRSKWLLYVSIFVNVVLNIWLLYICYRIQDSKIKYDRDSATFGFDNWNDQYFTVPIFLVVLYTSLIFSYIAVMTNILRMFRITEPMLYKEINTKLMSYLIFYIVFLSFRSFNYTYVQYFNFQSRLCEILYYISELIMITLISYIGLKNLEQENKQGGPNLKKSFQNVRNSFLHFANENERSNLIRNKNWSISQSSDGTALMQAENDFERVKRNTLLSSRLSNKVKPLNSSEFTEVYSLKQSAVDPNIEQLRFPSAI